MLRHLYLLQEEIRRSFIIYRRYWANELSFALTVYLIFLMLTWGSSAISGQALSNESKAASLVGMLMWQLSMGCMGVLGWSYFNEAATGTLEHLYLSPFGAARVFLARSAANFLSMIVSMVVAGALAMVTTGVRLDLPPLEIAVILPLSVAGTYGFGFLLAALTLTVKRTQSVMQLLQFFFFFFTGAIAPLDRLHWTIAAFGRTMPMTAGLEALREVTVHGARLGDVTHLLWQMTGTSVLWLAVGLVVYGLADRRARLRGSIGQY